MPVVAGLSLNTFAQYQWTMPHAHNFNAPGLLFVISSNHDLPALLEF